MRNYSVPRFGRAAVQAAALCAAFAAGTAWAQPRPSLRQVSETPQAAAPVAAPVAAPAAVLSAQELRETAVDAYIYAYPMVLMEITRRVATSVGSPMEGRAPMNQFGHKTTLPDASTSGVAWPSTDLLYSNLWYDVSREPLVVHIPDSGGRYYFMPVMDMWTDVFMSRGPRTTGNGAQTFAIVGPTWTGTVPAGVDVVRSPTNVGWIIGRIQVAGPADIAQAGQFQAGMSTAPLSLWNRAHSVVAVPGSGAPPVPMGGVSVPLQPGQASAPTDAWDTRTPAGEQVARMDAATFFATFAQVVQANPAHANDYPILDRMRRLGIEPGRPFSFAQLQPAVQQALIQAAPEANRRILNAVDRASRESNGWHTVRTGIGTYGTSYLRRAAVAYAGLGANTPEDAIYPLARTDMEGKPLMGDEDYVIHFDREQLPPVNAFWALVLYDTGHGFVDNPARRYSIGSKDPLRYNADGSLDIYVQSDAPSGDKRSNWLPAPREGAFMLNMRLYWPKAQALDGNWVPPVVRED